MIIEQTFTVDAPRERTAQFFLDIDRVAACVPGVEGVQQVEPGRYAAVLAVRLGPIRAAFQGTMTLDDAEAPARLRATGEGRDRATGSVARVSFTADLSEEEPGRTTVDAVADVALRGRMAQFGTGVLRAASSELVREFTRCANAALASPAPALGPAAAAGPAAAPPRPSTEPPVGQPAPPAPAAAGVLAVLLRGLGQALRRRLAQLARRLTARPLRVGGRR